MVSHFADCELDESLYQLRRHGAPVAIEPKVFDVLAYLLQHRDRVVSKDELLDKLWPGQVVGENALTRCIRAARSAVGDDGTKQEIITTQHGRGYRFVAFVTTDPQEDVSGSQQEDNQKATGEDGLELSIQSLESEDRLSPTLAPGRESLDDSTPARSWSIRSFPFLGVLLLVGIITAVQYLSLPTPNPQPLPLNPQPALPLPDKPSLIVLPFVNLSGDPAQEYFSDGVTTEITNTLSQLSSLFVISRMSAFTYKNKPTKVRDISREMGVQYVLDGSVRKTDEQLRVAVALIDATNDRQLWAEQYDRPFTNIFAVQDEIVRRIVTTLNLQLTLWEQGMLVRKRTTSLEAYDYALRGVELSFRAAYEAKKDLNAQARQMFEKAIELDPQYAEAYAGLGKVHYQDWFYVWSPHPAQSLEEAFQTYKTAVTFDDSLPIAHAILGEVYLWKKHHDQARVEAERAVTLAPSDADSLMYLGSILIFAGEPNRAIGLIEQAMRLNPRHPPAYLVSLAIAYRVMGRCEEALVPLRRAAALAPHFLQTRANLAMCYAELDRIPEAQAEVAELGRINPNFSLAWVTQRVPFKDPAIIERMVAAFRKAGLK